jgi:hypothetical protein
MYWSMDFIEVSAVVRMMPQIPALYPPALDMSCVTCVDVYRRVVVLQHPETQATGGDDLVFLLHVELPDDEARDNRQGKVDADGICC